MGLTVGTSNLKKSAFVKKKITILFSATSQRNWALSGRAIAQAASRQPLTAEARVRSRVSPCGICGGQSGTRTDFSPSTSTFPCQFHTTGAPLHGKTKTTNHLHHRVAQ